MLYRSLGICLVCVSMLLLGCRKGESPKRHTDDVSTNRQPEEVRVEIIGQLHWQGANRVRSSTNASDLRKVLQLPESRSLWDQTLNKLSGAPWVLSGKPLETNMAAQLRPLFDDALAEESYLALGTSGDPLPYLAWAIKLPETRAGLWKSNLISFMEAFVGAKPSAGKPGSWVWGAQSGKPAIFEFGVTNGWSVLSVAPRPNPILPELLARLGGDFASPVIWTTNYWLEAQVDLAQLGRVASRSHLPKCKADLSVGGDGKDLRIDVEFHFAEPLEVETPAWKVPTELMDAALSSFTAARGFEGILKSTREWKDIGLEATPNQAFWWAHRGLPNQSYFAFPSENVSNSVAKLSDWVLQNERRWSGSNELAGFKRAESSNGIEWTGLPYLWPFLKAAQTNDTQVVYGGLFPSGEVFRISPEAFRVLNLTNLLYYDWEVGSARVDEWLFVAQFLRFVFGKPQLPADSKSLLWLKAIAPHLGNSVTEGTLTRSNQISVVRKSSVGLTAIELQLLSEWLESPEFPRGLHVFAGTVTNSVHVPEAAEQEGSR